MTLSNGGSVVGTTTADGSGNWHVNGIALSDGTDYSFTATATDAAGNMSSELPGGLRRSTTTRRRRMRP